MSYDSSFRCAKLKSKRSFTFSGSSVGPLYTLGFRLQLGFRKPLKPLKFLFMVGKNKNLEPLKTLKRGPQVQFM